MNAASMEGGTYCASESWNECQLANVSYETPSSSGSPSESTKLSLRCKRWIDAPVVQHLVAIATHLLVVKMSLGIRCVGERKKCVSGYPADTRTRQEQREPGNDE